MGQVAEFYVGLRTKFDDSGIKKAESAYKGFVVTLGDVINITKTVISWGAKVVQAAAEQEKAEMLLANAIELTGNKTTTSIEILKKFATDLQTITTVGDETTLQLMQLGLTMGISGDKIKEATMSAIGLSKAFGIDLHTSMKLVALAGEGNYDMLARYIPALRSTKDATERARIANEAMARGFELAKAEGSTFSGQILIFKNNVGELAETIGLRLIPKLTEFIKTLNEKLIPALQSLPEKHLKPVINKIIEMSNALGFGLIVEIKKANDGIDYFNQTIKALINAGKVFINIGLAITDTVIGMGKGFMLLNKSVFATITHNKKMFKEAEKGWEDLKKHMLESWDVFKTTSDLKMEEEKTKSGERLALLIAETEQKTIIADTEMENQRNRQDVEATIHEAMITRKETAEKRLHDNRAWWAQQWANLVTQSLGAILDAETLTWSSVAKAYGQSIKNMIGYLIQQLAAEKIKSLAIALMNSTVTWGAAAYQIGVVIAAATAATIGLRQLMNFDKGGIVPGMIGQPQLAIVHGGETVIPPGSGASTINVYLPAITSRSEARRMGDIVGNEIVKKIKRTRKI